MYPLPYLVLLLTVGCSNPFTLKYPERDISCAEPEIVISDPRVRLFAPPTHDDLTEFEKATLYRARVRCSFYYEHSPCVARFEVYDRAAKAYRVTCREEELSR